MTKTRAALLSETSEGLQLADVDVPERKPGHALIEVHAASLNPLDLMFAAGKSYLGRPPFPYVPGLEGVGVVVESDAIPKGALVRFECAVGAKLGALSQRTLVDDSTAIVLPAGTPAPLAAALGVAGWAGWMSLEWRAQLMKGERVLILGATGAAGQVSVQAARILGASRIVAVGRNASALENAKALGAHATVALGDQDAPALAAAFTAAAGGPIDVVIDMLWGVPAVGALLALAPRGRLVNLGQSAGETATIPSGAVRGKTAAILGYTNFSVSFADKKAAFLRMLEHAAKGELTLAHDVIPLDGVAAAWQAQTRSPNQKLVIAMR